MKKEGGKAKTKSTARRVFGVIGDVVLVAFVALAIFVLVVSIVSKKDEDGAATIFGKQMRFVLSSSMEACDETDVSNYKIKSIKVKSCVFVDVIPEDEAEREKWIEDIKVGDVLTFKYVYTKQETITHRVVKKEAKSTGGYIITLEGDNKEDKTIVGQQTIDTSKTDSPNYIIGKVTGQSYLLGLLVYAFKTPVGIACFVIVPSVIMILFQVMRIVRVVSKDKKEKIAATQATQADEIEQLKRQLAMLQQGSQGAECEQAPQGAEQESESDLQNGDGQAVERGSQKDDETSKQSENERDEGQTGGQCRVCEDNATD